MEDDVSRRNRMYRRLNPSSHPQDDSSWFGGGHTGEGDTGEGDTDEQAPAGPADNPPAREPASQDQPDEPRRSASQRYADAIAALNQIVSTGDFSQLPQVTQVLRATAGAMGDNDPARAGVLNNLGSASQLMHMNSGDAEDLDDAVSYYRAAVSSATGDDPDLVLYLSNLTLALTDLAGRQDDARAAGEAARAGRKAVEQLAQDDPRRVTVLMRLGNALKTHARLAGEVASDDESIDVFREAARGSVGADAGAAPKDLSELLINLGSALLRRYERTASTDDLGEGIVHLRSGVGSLPDGEPRRATLCHLANALRLRFRHNGELGDLHSAINELLGVIGVLEAGHPLLGRALWNLGCTTVEHIDSTGEPGQMRRVLRVMGPASRSIANDDPDRAVALAALGALLRRHFLHGADSGALDSAISAGEAATEAATTPAIRCAVLNSLTTTLIARYEHTSDLDDLYRASQVADEAAETAPEGSLPLHTAWAQQGITAMYRYRRNSRQAELDTAIELFDQTLVRMPEDAPERTAVATHLGRALQTLYQQTGRRKLYRWARRILTEAAEHPGAPTDQRLRAASLCGRLAAQANRWAEAMESFTTAVEMLPLVTRGKRVVASPSAQQRWATIASDAAACAMEHGEPERAVELLEHARTALLSDFLPASGELGELHRWHPETTDQAVRLRRLLDRPPEEPVLAGLDVVSDGERRRRLAASWDELLHNVRSTDGYDQHLRRQPFDQISTVAEEGAVVLVNVSRYRSDALIVFAGRALVVPLPSLNLDNTAEQAANLLAAVQRDDVNAVAAILDWLWRHVTRPVLDRMGYLGTPPSGQRWPRMWWSTTGALAFLPLHAATAKTGESALDRVVSSYTPTLRCLLRAKEREPLRNGPRRAMVAAGSSEAAARNQELPPQNQVLARYWPTAEILSEEETSAADFLRLLPQHPWLHVCEPSTQFPSQPSAGLVLNRAAPRALGLVELGQISLGHAEFCYLGRCGSEAETPSAAAVTLGGALAFAGFAHVISSLWEVDAEAAAWLHGDVFASLTEGHEFTPDRGSVAMHSAARRLRAENPDDPIRWAGHLHVGP